MQERGKFVSVDKASSPWKLKYLTGLPDIDEQHRYCFFLIRAMDRSSKARAFIPLGEVLDELERYSRYHFGCEELLMDTYGYPGRSSHAARHAAIRAALADFRRSEAVDTARLRVTLYRWFATHVTREDKELANHVLRVREPLMAARGRGPRPAKP